MRSFQDREWLHGHFYAAAGKRLRESLADLAEADNCVAHILLLQITELGTLELRKAAVDGDFAGGHEAAVRRREKCSHGPDLRRIGHALERSHRGEDLLAFLA